jgi:dienelactone hydrolase
MSARAACLALSLAALLAPALVGAQERVQVPSLDARAGGGAVVLPGFWFPSAVDRAAPALVLLHGCGGPYGRAGRLSTRSTGYAHWLNGLGVHVLVTDSFTPRGERELCTQVYGGRAITQTQRRRDALGALHWLAGQPGVDAARLGLLGWSNGGSAVLAATNLGQREVAAAPIAPSLAVAFYPGCATELKAGYRASAPLLLLVGEADDWTPPGPCRELAAAATGAPVRFEGYAGAFHGFDTSTPVRLRRDVPNGVNPGKGVHQGGDPAASAASRERLQLFLRTQWALP